MKTKQMRWLAATLMLVAAMVMPSVAWADTITPSKPSGEGTANSPYQISNKEELYWFAGLVNNDPSVCNGDVNQNTAACAKLMNDIVVNSTDFSNHSWDTYFNRIWFFWTPIGKHCGNTYTGTFDGQGHTISGLYFESCSVCYDTTSKTYDEQNWTQLSFGLFGFNSGTIKNVGVVNSYFGWKYNLIGGVCGVNSGTIENCYNEGKVEGKDSDTGGVCASNSGSITNCYNIGTVIGNHGSGGVCVGNSGTIENCYNKGKVEGEATDNGGVCASNSNTGTIENCYNTGELTGGNSSGGVCGKNCGIIKKCYNTGKIICTGPLYFGGVCSDNFNTIENCYNTGEISGSSGNVGGVCGELKEGTIKNCFNTGAVNCNSPIGGVCGVIYNNGTITNCYYLSGTATGGINGADAAGSAEGKTAEKFRSGEVAYLLAQGCTVGETFYDGSVWGQQLKENDYPVLGSAYKVLMAAQDGLEGSIYWATFSNLNSNAELIDPMGDIAVYNATVSDGTLTLAKRSDNKVSSSEGVLLKANSEYVNAKDISDEVSAATTGENDLLATPAEAGVLNDTNYKHYRLTYNDVETKEGIGFYLGVVKDETGNVTSNDGSQIRVTPGKAYLKVLTSETQLPASTTYARSFAFPRDNGGTTGIGDIVIKGDAGINGSADGDGSIYDLQGRKVSKPTKGLYIKNNKKIVVQK